MIVLDAKRLVALGILIALGIAVTYTYIQALFAFIAPSEKYPLRILEVNTQGKNTFSRGETVTFQVKIEMAVGYQTPYGYYYWYYCQYRPPTYYCQYYYWDYFIESKTYKVIIAVMDGDKRPMVVMSKADTITRGETHTITFSWTIPSGAATGTYKVRAMAWSEWLPTGVALAPEAKETSFTVT
ncbi:MAG TPA: hypothetical protein ENF89_03905 [Candidatus Bathyarchaeota archaeon]|nr:hypothetical protein [Candidatus Bathyarchaeota archaeon]